MEIEIRRDSTPTLKFVVTNSDGSAANLNSCTIALNAIDESGNIVLSKSLDDGLSLDADPATGIFYWAIATSDTSAFTGSRRLFFDALIQTSAGDAFNVAVDSILHVKSNITRV